MHKALVVLAALTLLSGFNPVWASNYSIPQAEGYLRSHNWQALLQYAEAWAKAEPGNVNPWMYISAACGPAGLKNYQRSAEACRKVLAISPNTAPAWNALGISEVHLGQNKEAQEHFRKAISLAPNDASFRNNLAAACSNSNDRAGTVSALVGMENRGHLSATEWFNLGNDYSSQMEYSRAIHAYQQCLQLNPKFGPAWNNLGNAQLKLGNTSAAAAAYKKSIACGNKGSAANLTYVQNLNNAAHFQGNQPTGGHYSPYRVMRMTQRAIWQQEHPPNR